MVCASFISPRRKADPLLQFSYTSSAIQIAPFKALDRRNFMCSEGDVLALAPWCVMKLLHVNLRSLSMFAPVTLLGMETAVEGGCEVNYCYEDCLPN